MSADPREGEIVVIPYGEDGDSPTAERETPAADEVEELERTADAARGNLSALVTELGKRGKRALLPLAVGAGLLGVAGIAAAVVLSRRRQARATTTFLRSVSQAARRAVAHPERVARPEPRGISKIAIAAGTAAASMIARRLVQRMMKAEPRAQLS